MTEAQPRGWRDRLRIGRFPAGVVGFCATPACAVQPRELGGWTRTDAQQAASTAWWCTRCFPAVANLAARGGIAVEEPTEPDVQEQAA